MKRILKLLFACIPLLSACTNDTGQPITLDRAVLQPELLITRNISSRVTETHFQEGEEVGFLLLTPSGSLYNTSPGYQKYTYNNRRWTCDNPTFLGNEEVRVYAAFPWSTTLNYALHRHLMPIETTSQTDYLVGKQIDSSFINAQNPTTRLSMGHALAKLRFTITRGTYIGVGKVTNAQFSCTEGGFFGTGYKTDLITGTINTTEGVPDHNRHNIGSWGNSNIILSSTTAGPEGTEYLAVPGNGKLKIDLTIDQVAYSVICNIDGSTSTNGYPRTLKAGSTYTINLRMTGSSLIINSDNVTLNNWYNSGALGTH